MKIECKVDLSGFEGRLIELGPKLARKSMRKALTSVGKFWVGEVKSRVPVDTGALKDSIISRVRVKKGGTEGKVSVGPGYTVSNKVRDTSQDPGVYGMFVEFPMKNRPTYPTQPFMRPTFDSTADKAVEIFADSLKEALEGSGK
jgi:HK97 gp10 family phage protein